MKTRSNKTDEPIINSDNDNDNDNVNFEEEEIDKYGNLKGFIDYDNLEEEIDKYGNLTNLIDYESEYSYVLFT